MLDARYRYYCMYLKSRSWCNGRVQQHNSLTLWADHTIAPDTCAGSTTHSHKEHGIQRPDCLWDNSPFFSATIRL